MYIKKMIIKGSEEMFSRKSNFRGGKIKCFMNSLAATNKKKKERIL